MKKSIHENQWELDIEEPKVMAAKRMSLKEISNLRLTSKDDIDILKEQLAYFRPSGYKFLYRGLSDSVYELLPTIARNKECKLEKEREVLEQFKVFAKGRKWDRFCLTDFNEDLFYMSIARHLELYSRLLDWTSNLETALAFLVSENESKSGTLCILIIDEHYVITEKDKSPFDIKDENIHFFNEEYYFSDCTKDEIALGICRRWNQNGFFTVTSENNLYTPLDKITDSHIIKISVSAEDKTKLIESTDLKERHERIWKKNDDIDLQSEIKRLNDFYIS